MKGILVVEETGAEFRGIMNREERSIRGNHK